MLFVVPRLAAAYPDGLTQIWQIFSEVVGVLDDPLRFFYDWLAGGGKRIYEERIYEFFRWWVVFNVRRRRRNVGFLLFVVLRLAAAYPDGLTQIWQIFLEVGGTSQSRQLKSV